MDGSNGEGLYALLPVKGAYMAIGTNVDSRPPLSLLVIYLL